MLYGCTAEPAPKPRVGLEALWEECLAAPGDSRSCALLARRCASEGAACSERLEAELLQRAATADGDPAPDILRSWLYFRLDRPDDEWAALEDALAQAERNGAPGVRAGVHLNLARASQGDDVRRALEHFDSATSLALEAGDIKTARKALHGASASFRRLGLFADQLRAAQTLVGLLDGLDARHGAQAELALADAERRLGRTRDARASLERALEHARRSESPRDIAYVQLALGITALDENEPQNARRRLLDAREQARLAKRPRLANEARVLAAAALLAEGRAAEALEELDALPTDEAALSGLARVHLDLYRGQALLEQGDITGAERAFHRAAKSADQSQDEDLVWESLSWLASCQRRAGKLGEAVASARRAVAIIERGRGAVAARTEPLSFLHLRADAYTVLAESAAAQAPAALDEAFSTVERAHARALRESLVTPRDRSAGDPELDAMTLAGLRALLDEDELLLVYQLGEPHSLVLAVSRAASTAHPLPGRRAIEEQVAQYREALTAPIQHVGELDELDRGLEELRRIGSSLARTLLRPVEERLPSAARLTIVPDRALYRLPFEALPSEPRSTGEGASFLGLERAVSYLPASALRSRRIGTVGASLVLVDAPEAWPEKGLPHLRHASAESRALLELYPPSQRLHLHGESASLGELGRALGTSPELLHVIAHAELTPREGPRILLGRDLGAMLDAASIETLEPAPRLAVLSACETGGGELLGGEGVLGLVRAFQRAGTPGIVASLWPVDDRASATLMTAFHGHLHQKLPPSEALLEARREVARELSLHPFAWAPFVLYGAD